MKRMASFIVLLCLWGLTLSLATAEAQAQQNTQNPEELFVSANGQLAFRLPAGWGVEDDGWFIGIANTQLALEKMSGTTPLTADEVAALFTVPDALPEFLGLPRDAAPRDVLETVMALDSFTGSISDISMQDIDGAFALVTGATLTGETVIVAYALPQGTVFAIVQTGGSISEYAATFDAIVETLIEETAALDSGDTMVEQPTDEAVTTVHGVLTPEAVEHVWSVQLTAGDTVTIELVALSDELDPYLSLYQAETYVANGTPVASNDDSFNEALGYLNSRIVYSVAQTDSYIISVSSFDKNDTGAYELSIRGDDSYALESMTGNVPAYQPVEIRQWASSATGTSEYGSVEWGFQQATGAPDTTDCGDFNTAWASASSQSTDLLALEFDEYVYPTQVNIYQTHAPGSITYVALRNSNTGEMIVIPDSADPPGNTPCPGVFTLDLSEIDSPVNSVVIFFDQRIGRDWNEIDAVELVGVSAPVPEGSGPQEIAAFETADDVVSGMLWEEDSRHLWRATLTSGDRITVTIVADDLTLDPTVAIYSSLEAYQAGRPMASNLDLNHSNLGGNMFNAQIVDLHIPESGEYIIMAARLRGSGLYRLGIESTGEDTVELEPVTVE